LTGQGKGFAKTQAECRNDGKQKKKCNVIDPAHWRGKPPKWVFIIRLSAGIYHPPCPSPEGLRIAPDLLCECTKVRSSSYPLVPRSENNRLVYVAKAKVCRQHDTWKYGVEIPPAISVFVYGRQIKVLGAYVRARAEVQGP